MNKKIILGVCAAVAVALLSTAHIYNFNNKANTDKSLKVFFNESRKSQDKLIEDADIIVRCTFEGEAKTETKTALTKGTDGKEFTVTSPVTAYKMKLVENLKGVVNDEFEIGLIGSTNENFEDGVEYVLFLDKSDTDGKYTLVSYNQGFNKIIHKGSNSKDIKTNSDSLDESIEIESVETKEVINYKDLKDKIKEVEK